MGTVGYMSPEQVRGQPARPALRHLLVRAVLYEMLTGGAPFQRETAAETMTAILRRTRRSSRRRGDGPFLPASTGSCGTASRRSRNERFQSARDLAFALESAVGRVGPGRSCCRDRRVRRSRPAPVGPLPWIFAGGLAAAAAAFAALWAARERTASDGPPTLRFTIAPPANTSFAGMVALSPDGSRLAFAASRADGRASLWIRPLDAVEPRPLDGTDGASFPFWSPDGRWLAFFAQGKLKKIEASGGTPQTLCDAPGARGGTWSPSGTILFSAFAGGEIDRVAESGGSPSPSPISSRTRGALPVAELPSRGPALSLFRALPGREGPGNPCRDRRHRGGVPDCGRRRRRRLCRAGIHPLPRRQPSHEGAFRRGTTAGHRGRLAARRGRLVGRAHDPRDRVLRLAERGPRVPDGRPLLDAARLVRTVRPRARAGRPGGGVRRAHPFAERALARAHARRARDRSRRHLGDGSRAEEPGAGRRVLALERPCDSALEPGRRSDRLREVSGRRRLSKGRGRRREREAPLFDPELHTTRLLLARREAPLLRPHGLEDVQRRHRREGSRGGREPAPVRGPDLLRVGRPPLPGRTMARVHVERVRRR